MPRMSSALATPASARAFPCRFWICLSTPWRRLFWPPFYQAIGLDAAVMLPGIYAEDLCNRVSPTCASRPGRGGAASSLDLGQAPVQSKSNSARGWITANWVGCSPNDRAQSTGRKAMFRAALAALAAVVLVTASLIPDDAFARRGGGGGFRGGGGFHGGGSRGGGVHRRCDIPSQVARASRISNCRSSRSSGLPGRGPRVLSRIRIRCGGGRGRSGWCRGLWRLWRLQQLLRCVRQLDLSRPVSILTRAKRMPTAVGPVLTAVLFSCFGCRDAVFAAA